MNAISTIFAKKQPSSRVVGSIPPEAIEASHEAVKGYAISRIQNAERLANVSARYGTFGMFFGIIWLAMWLAYPREHDVHHWMIWDGVHGIPYELPDLNTSVQNAPQAVNQYFSEDYVVRRERYYYDLAAEDRAHVSWQTGHEEMANYLHDVDAKNPDAPIIDLGKNGFIEVEPTGGTEVEVDPNNGRIRSKVYFYRRYQKYGQKRADKVLWFAEFTWEKHPENVADDKRNYSPIGMVTIHYHRQKANPDQ